MRGYIIFIVAILVLTACGTSPTKKTETNTSSPAPTNSIETSSPSPAPANKDQQLSSAIETVKQFLITSAAGDFRRHGPSGPLQFRNVRVGHVAGDDGKESYRLCGEFQQDGKADWTPFVTIKTSGYEQYIGGNTTYCSSPSMIWDIEDDLSPALKSHLDSLLQNKSKLTANGAGK